MTTGPMLLAEVDGRPAGTRVTVKAGKSRRVEIAGEVISDEPVHTIEIIVNGEVVRRLAPQSRRNRNETKFRETIELTGSSWIAVRCWEPRADGRIRFAHTAPWFFDAPNAPLRPGREEIDFAYSLRAAGNRPQFRCAAVRSDGQVSKGARDL